MPFRPCLRGREVEIDASRHYGFARREPLDIDLLLLLDRDDEIGAGEQARFFLVTQRVAVGDAESPNLPLLGREDVVGVDDLESARLQQWEDTGHEDVVGEHDGRFEFCREREQDCNQRVVCQGALHFQHCGGARIRWPLSKPFGEREDGTAIEVFDGIGTSLECAPGGGQG